MNSSCGTPSNVPIYVQQESQKENRERAERIFEEEMPTNFPHLMTNIHPHTPKAQWTPKSINSKTEQHSQANKRDWRSRELKEKALVMYKKSSIKWTANFPSEAMETRRIPSTERENPVNHEFYMWQNDPVKTKRSLDISKQTRINKIHSWYAYKLYEKC